MYEIFLVNAFESLEYFDQDSEGLLKGKGFSRESGLIGEEVALVAVIEDDEDEVGCVNGGFLADDVVVVELLHDFDFLFDVLLQKGFLFDLGLPDDFDGE